METKAMVEERVSQVAVHWAACYNAELVGTLWVAANWL